MVVIGLTGSIGTGKSTVARMFRRLGAVVLDADVLAREVVRPGSAGARRIRKAFGPGVFGKDGALNRRRLAALVFKSDARRRVLERIIHPLVYRRMREAMRGLARSRKTPAVVLDVPLLLETGGQALADVVVVVTAPPEVQRRRVRRKHGWTHKELAARMRAKWKPSAKVALADYVVDNADGLRTTRTQVTAIWKQAVRRMPAKRSSTSRRSKS